MNDLKAYTHVAEELDAETDKYALYAYDVDGNRTPVDETELVYLKSEADVAIAELKAENERLVKCCEEYDSRQRLDERIKFNGAKQLRATKHALWMARKAHAVAMFAYWDSHYRDNPNAVYRNRTIEWLRNRWLLILDAIIKKEEEYK